MSQHHRAGGWTSADLRVWRPRIAATLPTPCVDCGHPVYPEQRWQVGHIVPVWQGGTKTADNLGPSHSNGSGPGGRSCNQSAGGRMGAAKTNASKKAASAAARRLPNW